MSSNVKVAIGAGVAADLELAVFHLILPFSRGDARDSCLDGLQIDTVGIHSTLITGISFERLFLSDLSF